VVSGNSKVSFLVFSIDSLLFACRVMAQPFNPAVVKHKSAVESPCSLTRITTNIVTSILIPKYLALVDIGRCIVVSHAYYRLIVPSQPLWKALFIRSFPSDWIKSPPSVMAATTVATATTATTLSAANDGGETRQTPSEKKSHADSEWYDRYRDCWQRWNDSRESFLNGSNIQFSEWLSHPHAPYHIIRLILFGSSNVGKTSFLTRVTEDTPPSDAWISTIGIDFKIFRTVLPEWFMHAHSDIVPASRALEVMADVATLIKQPKPASHHSPVKPTPLNTANIRHGSSLPVTSIFHATRGSIKVQLWDHPSGDRYYNRFEGRKSYYRNAHAIILCYRIDVRSSFDELRTHELPLLQSLRSDFIKSKLAYDKTGTNYDGKGVVFDDWVVMVLACQSDRSDKRAVTEEEGRALAREIGPNALFTECSSLSGEGVIRAIRRTVYAVMSTRWATAYPYPRVSSSSQSAPPPKQWCNIQ